MSILSLLLPILGQVTAFCLFYSSCPALLKDRGARFLSVDPLPYPVALVSTLLWIVYGALIGDPWILAGNFVGLGATSFNTVTVLRLCSDDRTARLLERIVIGGLVVVAAAIAICMSPMFIDDVSVRRGVAGGLCIAIVLAMFASPTLGALRALRSGDASQVSLPLSVAQLANGVLWATYGMVQGDVVVVGPNGFGALLALLNLFAKVRSSSRLAPARDDISAGAPLKSVQPGTEVLLRSMLHSGYVHVAPLDPLDAPADAESAQSTAQVLSDSIEGTVLQVVSVASAAEPADVTRIALRDAHGRFLCVQPRSSSVCVSAFVPSLFGVVALHRDQPGPEGEFVPVYGKALESDPIVHSKVAVHNYRDESVSFWNPMHQVFVRANELGGLDCSPECRSSPSGGVIIPAGWEWERFTLHAAPAATTIGDGVRQRSRAAASAA